MARFAGKIAFITGIGSGQGQTAMHLFASEGALVVGCYRSNAAGAAATARMIEDLGRQIILHQVDLSDRDAARDWINEGAAAAGGIDILYNNAASVKLEAFPEMPYEAWDYTLRNELEVVFHATQAAWPHMVARGGGSIINIASTVGLRGRSALGAAAHATGKAGLTGLTRQLAAEGAKHRIRANTISPGAIATPALKKNDDDVMQKVIDAIPLGRMASRRTSRIAPSTSPPTRQRESRPSISSSMAGLARSSRGTRCRRSGRFL